MATSVATAQPDPRLGCRRRRSARRELVGFGFVSPYVAVFVLGTVLPLLYALYLSLFQDRLVGGVQFVGFGNYLAALTDELLADGAVRVVGYFFVQVPIMTAIALIAALAIDSGRLHRPSVPRIILFLPYAVPSVIATIMWGYIYGTESGLITQAVSALGLASPDLLGGQLIMVSIGNIATWTFVGYNMLIFYSALRAVPEEIYEAARMDGAGEIRIAFSLKLPAIRRAIVLSLMFSIIGTFQLFNEPNVLRAVAPDVISSYFTPNMYTYNLAFTSAQYNYAAAVALVIGVATALAAVLLQWLNRSLNAEGDE